MIYADSLRKLRQREYDNIELYSELDAIKAEEKKNLSRILLNILIC